jgi:succinoglycan biosynthesis transport protein ExoP
MSDAFPRFDLDEEEGGGLPALLRDPVGVLKRGWRWSLIAFVLLIIPAVLASRLIPLQFEATSRLMLNSKAIPDTFVQNTIVASSAEQFDAIENRVLTRDNLKEMVVTNNAFAEERKARAMASVVDDFRNAIQIEKKPVRGGIRGHEPSIAIQVSLRGRESKQVAGLVNSITTDLINEFLAYRGEQSQVASDFMRREFENADESLREHQRTLAIFREQNRGSLPEEQLATVGRLERLESQRRSIILQNNDARAQLSTSGTTTSPAGVIVVSPRERMQIELNRLLGLYTEEYPQIQSLRRRIAALEESSSEDPEASSNPNFISNPRIRLKNEIAARQMRLDEIDAEVTRLEMKVARTSGITEDYRSLERKEVILQEAYTEYLRKLKSAELSRSMEMAQQGTQLVRLEAARPPTAPIIPRVAFTAAALVVALAGSLLLGVAREILNPVIIDAAHLEQITSLPTLGSIPPVARSV